MFHILSTIYFLNLVPVMVILLFQLRSGQTMTAIAVKDDMIRFVILCLAL